MKRHIIIALVLVLALSLAACGGGNSNSGNSGGNTNTPANNSNAGNNDPLTRPDNTPDNTPSGGNPSSRPDTSTIDGYLAQFGFTQDDISTDNLTEINFNHDNTAVEVFTSSTPTNEAVKAWFDSIYSKCASLSDDGKLYYYASMADIMSDTRTEYIPDERIDWNQDLQLAPIFSGIVYNYNGTPLNITLAWSIGYSPAFSFGGDFED